MSARECEVIVVGAGIAGTTAAMTAARFGRRVIVLEQMGPGGQIINATHIWNLPGFPAGIAGVELGPLLHEQAEAAGAEFVLDTVQSLTLDGNDRIVECVGESLRAPCVIVAAGSTLRNLGIPGEATFAGRGVSHCASCDGPFFRGKRVCVVGGGDAAIDEALVLAEFASEVVVIHRGSELKAQRTLVEQAEALPKIGFAFETRVEEIVGNGAVSGIRFTNLANGTSHDDAFAAVKAIRLPRIELAAQGYVAHVFARAGGSGGKISQGCDFVG